MITNSGVEGDLGRVGGLYFANSCGRCCSGSGCCSGCCCCCGGRVGRAMEDVAEDDDDGSPMMAITDDCNNVCCFGWIVLFDLSLELGFDFCCLIHFSISVSFGTQSCRFGLKHDKPCLAHDSRCVNGLWQYGQENSGVEAVGIFGLVSIAPPSVLFFNDVVCESLFGIE